MVNEAVRWMFGYYWPLALIVAVVGFLIGVGTQRWGWRIAWIILFAVFFPMSLVNMMGRWVSDAELLTWDFVWTVWFALFLWVGAGLRSAGDRLAREELQQESRALSIDDLLESIEHVASNPAVAVTPWVAKRWFHLPRDHKRTWVERNAEALRKFIVEQGGIEAVQHAAFVMELQRLDRLTQAPSGRTATEG